MSLREAELRIVLHGIQIPLPPPASTQADAANEGKGAEEVGHAEGGAGWRAKEDGGSEPIFFVPLSTMTATAEALRTVRAKKKRMNHFNSNSSRRHPLPSLS